MALTKPRAYQIYDIDYKQAVRVVSTSNVTLAGGAPNSVDGVNLSLNDRILVTAQTSGAQNGIYYVTTLGSGANGTWTRSVDTDVTGELLSGTIVMVTEGSTYADTQWKLTTNDPITIGSTALTFVQNYLANSISYGATAFAIASTNANATISVAGTSNVAVFATTGEYVTGVVSASGNITGGNLLTGGIISSTGNATVGNISATVGTFTTFNSSQGGSVTGTLIATSSNAQFFNQTNGAGYFTVAGYLSSVGNITSAGNISGNYILGNGSQLSGLPATYANTNVAAYLASGTDSSNIITTANVSGGNITTTGLVTATSNITGGNLLTGGIISATGNISGNYFVGNGSLLTGISGGIVYTANTAPPSSGNVVGAQWYNTSTGAVFEYQTDGTSTYWVDITGPTVANGSVSTTTTDSLSPFLLMGA